MGKLLTSGKNRPCPVCDRTHDNDCRIGEQGNLVLCHTHQSETEPINGYRWVKRITDGAGWGLFAWGEPKGLKYERPSPPLPSIHYYLNRETLQPIVAVERHENPKSFYQKRIGKSGELINGLDGVNRELIGLYRLDEVRQATQDKKTIYWVEGEGVVESLRAIGLCATTTIGGCNALGNYGPPARHMEDLKRASMVVVMPDRDRKGVEYADQVISLLKRANIPHQIMHPFPDSVIWEYLPENNGLDAADWIKEGAIAKDFTPAPVLMPSRPKKNDPYGNLSPDERYNALTTELLQIHELYRRDKARLEFELVAQSKAFNCPFKTVERIYRSVIRPSRQGLGIISSIELFKQAELEEIEDSNWLIPDLIRRGSTILFYAQGGTGKTRVSYQLAAAAASGRKFLDNYEIPQPIKTLFVQIDEPRSDTKATLLFSENFVSENFDFLETSIRLDDLTDLEDLITESGYQLVFLDSYTALNSNSGIEDKDTRYADALYDLRDIADRTNCSFVVIHHTNKGGDYRGTTAMRDNVSVCWELRKFDKDRDNFNLDDRQRVLHIGGTKIRGIGGKSNLILRFNQESGSFNFEQHYEELSNEDRPATCSELIMAMYEANPLLEATTPEITERIEFRHFQYDTIRQGLYRLKQRGKLAVIRTVKVDGAVGKDQPVYCLPSRKLENQCHIVTLNPQTQPGQGIENVTGKSDTNVTGGKNLKTVTLQEGGVTLSGDGVTLGVTDGCHIFKPSQGEGLSDKCNNVTPISIETSEHKNGHSENGVINPTSIDSVGEIIVQRPRRRPLISENRKPVNPYSGPPEGTAVTFIPRDQVPAATLNKLVSQGQELPWSQSGIIESIDLDRSGRYFAIVVTDQNLSYVVWDFDLVRRVAV